MITNNNVSGTPERLVKMTKLQAAFFIGEVFCTLDQFEKKKKQDFLKDLVMKISADPGLAEISGGSSTVTSLHYDELNMDERTRILVNSIAGLITGNDMYADQFSSFSDVKGATIEIEKDPFFKKKITGEKFLFKNEANLFGLLRENHFTKAISMECHGMSLDGLEKGIHAFADESMPLINAYKNDVSTITKPVSALIFGLKKEKAAETVPVLVKNT